MAVALDGDLLDAERLLGLRHLVARDRTEAPVTALPGGSVSKRRGRGLDLLDLRAYVHGDEARHIDRNATARTGRLQVRTFLADRDRTTVLIVDFRPSMLWGTRRVLRSVAAAEAACLAGWRTIGDGGRVAVVAATGSGLSVLGPAGGMRGMVGVVGLLVEAHRTAVATAAAPEEQGLRPALEAAARIAPAGAEVVLFSALETPGHGAADSLAELAGRHPVRAVRIVDALEDGAPAGHYAFRSPGGRSGIWSGRAAPPRRDPEWVEQAGAGLSVYRAALKPEEQPAHG